MAYTARKDDAGSRKKTPAPVIPQAAQPATPAATPTARKTATVQALRTRHGSNLGLYLYDLEAGEKEIAALENALNSLEREASLARSRSALQNTYLGPQARQDFDFVGNAAQAKTVRRELSQKKQAYNLAKHYQETIAFEDTALESDFDRFDDYIPSDDPLHNWINDPAYREAYEASYQSAPNPNAGKSRYARKGYDRMTGDEIAIYNYYYAKGGRKAAQEYLDNLQETLNGRIAADLYGRIQGDTVKELTFGVTAGFRQAGANTVDFFNRNDDYIPESPYAMASHMAREDLSGVGPKLPDWLGGASVGQVAYDVTSTTANMAPSILLSVATGVPMAGNALMGIGAAGGAYRQALNEGFSKDQARGYSTLVGLSEVAMEKLLGGVSALGGNKLSKTAMQNIANADTALKKIAWQLGSSTLKEFREEYLQEVFEQVYRNLMLGTDERIELFSPQALYSGIIGALTGPLAEGETMAVTASQERDAEIRAQKKKPAYWDPMTALVQLKQEQLTGWERARVDSISTIRDIDPNDAVAIVDILEQTDSAIPEMDALAAREAYLYGYYGIPDDLLSRQPYFYSDLPDSRQQAIYDIGSAARTRKIETGWQKMQQKKARATIPEAASPTPAAEISTAAEASAREEIPNPQAEGLTDADTTAEWLFADAKDRDSFSADARDKLTEIVKNGTIKLQRGFMCFPENDPLVANSKNVVPKEGFFDVAMHGSPTAVGFGTDKANMSPRLLANIIRHREDYHGENIRLLSCSTGLIEGDRYCFAEELANALGVIVEAPNMKVYTYPNGTIKVGWLGEGKMIAYSPNERGRIAARKEDKK